MGSEMCIRDRLIACDIYERHTVRDAVDLLCSCIIDMFIHGFQIDVLFSVRGYLSLHSNPMAPMNLQSTHSDKDREEQHDRIEFGL